MGSDQFDDFFRCAAFAVWFRRGIVLHLVKMVSLLKQHIDFLSGSAALAFDYVLLVRLIVDRGVYGSSCGG